MVNLSRERAAIGRMHAVDSIRQAPALLPSRIACCQGASHKVRPAHDGNACIRITCGTDDMAAAPQSIPLCSPDFAKRCHTYSAS